MRSALFVLLFFTGLFARAFEVPPLQSGVNDYANILDQRVANQLAEALTAIMKNGGPQLAVLTVDSIDPLTIEDASFQVARSWKLGTSAKDNGILLLVARKERKVRIEVGQGMEGDLTDAYSYRIINNIIVPQFRAGSYTNGVVMGVDAILSRMDPPIRLHDYMQMQYEDRPQVKVRGNWFPILIWLAIFIILAISRGGRGGGGSGLMWFLLGNAMGSSRGWRGGGGSWGGSSGGWSGGGGGFSGGGASGSW